ncbi:hypothetical protein GCM10011608_33000 [Micromonospora sonchi]|uniref:Uncharacterized protein n=1 Tax=Micromonospora sonchi TaxID=1763543 RepID=A0A917WYH1_9ACTN|nr:hypothetical protein [Micromonospora sonchi]GGM45630.1 hypothetical protein GCM10011608_33000 [Micromonospora sonchi]
MARGCHEGHPQDPRQEATPPKFAPKLNDNGRLDHSACGHTREMKGRAKCREAFRAAQEAAKK